MNLSIYQVDAFAGQLFQGNPAAVIPLQSWLDNDLMQNIAAENNLSETTFYLPQGDHFHIRWFTPTQEVRLCGHATLAAAHVLFKHQNYPKQSLAFQSKSGILKVEKVNNLYTMNFPADDIREVQCPVLILKSLQVQAKATFVGKDDYMLVLNSQKELENVQPDFEMLSLLKDARGVILTAPGLETDFVSRCFYPSYGINEDPATGSAHTTMTPYWANRLGKSQLTAIQLSSREGNIQLRIPSGWSVTTRSGNYIYARNNLFITFTLRTRQARSHITFILKNLNRVI